MGSIHLIRIPDRESRVCAMRTLIDVDVPWMSFPDNIYGIRTQHLDALKKSQIPYEDLSGVNN